MYMHKEPTGLIIKDGYNVGPRKIPSQYIMACHGDSLLTAVNDIT